MRKNIVLFILFYTITSGQIPNPCLIGYWHNWEDFNAPYIPLPLVDNRYDVIIAAFAVPKPPEDYDMEFKPVKYDSSTFVNQINFLKNQGKKIIISIGGGNSPIILNNENEMNTFISSINNIINIYGFEGIDIDLEGNSLYINGGTISNPTDKPIQYMIEAIKKIMENYYSANGKRLILTIAPQTANVQGGMESFAEVWGAYLPLIDALRDSLEVIHIQLYNSGSMRGIDGNIYNQGTEDFIEAMTEEVIVGFDTPGGFFRGLPESKIVIGLPACGSSAGGGYADTATVKRALDYLMGRGPKPGFYTLANKPGYPGIRGMMTWSINWDAVNTCHNSFEYAENYERIFKTTDVKDEDISEDEIAIFPNPFSDYISFQLQGCGKVETINLYDIFGRIIQTIQTDYLEDGGYYKFKVTAKEILQGIYFVKVEGRDGIKAVIKINN
ncbi:MAG: T9SS type A sorting domain-containing protein [Ignavibacteriae bacterium]|nr:T9SS type A sorting domain-containing protein [Ignavibacteriota bacterium]